MAMAIVAYKGKPRLIEGPDELTLEKFIRRIWPGRVRKVYSGRYFVEGGVRHWKKQS